MNSLVALPETKLKVCVGISLTALKRIDLAAPQNLLVVPVKADTHLRSCGYSQHASTFDVKM